MYRVVSDATKTIATCLADQIIGYGHALKRTPIRISPRSCSGRPIPATSIRLHPLYFLQQNSSRTSATLLVGPRHKSSQSAACRGSLLRVSDLEMYLQGCMVRNITVVSGKNMRKDAKVSSSSRKPCGSTYCRSTCTYQSWKTAIGISVQQVDLISVIGQIALDTERKA